MIVLFRNIPSDSYHNDFTNMIQPVIKGGLFKAQGSINNIDIIALKEEGTESLEFQALATIEPETAATKVIKQLNGKFIRGCRITVRQYFVRSWKNDKRNEESDTNWPGKEKRTNISRRRKLKILKVALPDYH
jgi:hypothetical protein